MSVRQKHAHSWVEAYLGPSPDGMPIWLTLDPTPASEREQSVAQVGGFSSNFRQITDLIRYVWVFLVVGYNAERQNRLIYEPLYALINEAKRGFAMMRQALEPLLNNVVHFDGHFISIPGFVVTFLLLLLLVGLARGGYWLFARVWRWYRGSAKGSSSLSAGVAFYRRLTQLLEEFGLERPPAETHYEFARRAGVFLAGQGSSTEGVSEVPRLVVDAFYRVRFGHLTLPPAALSDLEARLDALEQSLRATQA
jgi:hypothetical protein